MKTKIGLVGRRAILNFPNYNREGALARNQPLAKFMIECLGIRHGLASYVDQEVEITNEKFGDDLHTLSIELPDGKIERVYPFDLTLLPAPPPEAPRWEYCSCVVEWRDGTNHNPQVKMAKLGEDGWELVAVDQGEGYFKRLAGAVPAKEKAKRDANKAG